MSKKMNKYLERVLILSPFIIVALLVIACIIFRIMVMINYGDTPITEIPAWAFWVMQSGSN